MVKTTIIHLVPFFLFKNMSGILSITVPVRERLIQASHGQNHTITRLLMQAYLIFKPKYERKRMTSHLSLVHYKSGPLPGQIWNQNHLFLGISYACDKKMHLYERQSIKWNQNVHDFHLNIYVGKKHLYFLTPSKMLVNKIKWVKVS